MFKIEMLKKLKNKYKVHYMSNVLHVYNIIQL